MARVGALRAVLGALLVPSIGVFAGRFAVIDELLPQGMGSSASSGGKKRRAAVSAALTTDRGVAVALEAPVTTAALTRNPSAVPTHLPSSGAPTPEPTVTSAPSVTPKPSPQPTPLPTGQPTPVPSPSPTVVPTVHMECSALRCTELGWDYEAWGSATVCGATDGAPLDSCGGQMNWDGARARCQGVGARLCSLAELQADEARDTGCNLNTALVWARDRCASDDGNNGEHHLVGWGSTVMGSAASFCLNGTALGGKATAGVRCCADVDPCEDPTPSPTPLPTAAPSALPTRLPSAVPTAAPTAAPSHAPTTANVTTDCDGNAVPHEWVGDGFCDGGWFDYGGSAVNLNCLARAWDGGDCAPLSAVQQAFPEADALSRTCGACAFNVTTLVNGTNVTSYDCPMAPAEWIGDGVCDVGNYSYGGAAVDLDCPFYHHDGYDCCLQDARYMQTFNGTAPACLSDARGHNGTTCVDLYGPAPACWLTDAGGRTCEWLTKVLGGCDERIKSARHPHVELRECADSCIFSNCTQDYALELVQTYYDMCVAVPSSSPTPAPSPAPTVTYSRKVQCDVQKQQTCATRHRGDSCTDWQLECFHVQCPSGLEANERDLRGKCFRESPHEADHRTFQQYEAHGEAARTGFHQDPGTGLASGSSPLNGDRFEPVATAGALAPELDYFQNSIYNRFPSV